MNGNLRREVHKQLEQVTVGESSDTWTEVMVFGRDEGIVSQESSDDARPSLEEKHWDIDEIMWGSGVTVNRKKFERSVWYGCSSQCKYVSSYG